MEFSQKLKNLRKEKKFSQRDMAKLLQISQPGYAKYENALSEPDLKSIKKIAEIFEISIDNLLDNTNELTTTTQSAVISPEQAKNIWFSTLSDLDKTLINTFLKLNELQKYKTQVYIYSMLSPE